MAKEMRANSGWRAVQPRATGGVDPAGKIHFFWSCCRVSHQGGRIDGEFQGLTADKSNQTGGFCSGCSRDSIGRAWQKQTAMFWFPKAAYSGRQNRIVQGRVQDWI